MAVQYYGLQLPVEESNMELFRSPNTCSMGEIGNLLESYDKSLEAELALRIDDAELHDRKMLIANVAAEQARDKELLAALRKHGFKKVGLYFGNSGQDVHVYIRGLKKARAKK